MIIDFHTHTFPEHMAAKTLESLSKCSGIVPSTDGTLQDLKRSMEQAEIDLSVVLPVVTNPAHFYTVNKVAAEVCEKNQGILSLGGIHPECSDLGEKLKEIKSMGLKGIKIHPAYQRVNMDDIRYLRILDKASELDLIVVVHAGVDIGLPEPVYADVNRIVTAVEETAPTKFVLAHLGGWKQWDLVEEKLCGRNVYMDTAFIEPYVSREQIIRIIRKHGADKILFGTDCPWSAQKTSVEALKEMNLSEEEKQKILGNNGAKLLGV